MTLDDLALARALHVLAVVIWIGGVTMMTTVVLPAVRRGDLGADRLKAFQAVERRFAWQARAATLVVGATGLYMTSRLDLWDRFQSAQFWWMHAMVCLWLIYALVLFVIEPLILRRHFHDRATRAPDQTFAAMQRGHWLLLALSLITVFAAVAGSQGWSIF